MSTDEQIQKLNELSRMAKEAAASTDFIQKIGATTLYAGLADFLAIQTARLIEQVILKAQLEAGEEARFRPRSDSYFYDKRVDTRRILKVIKKEILPFKAGSPDSAAAAERANTLAKILISKMKIFLNYRNGIIHHLGSPQMTLGKLNTLCDKAILAYEHLQHAHTAFCEALQPYRFGEKELQYFYSDT